jgi:glycine cleavage system H protein
MDFMPTKGIEYLLVIGYLLLFVPIWMLIQRGRPRLAPLAASAVEAVGRAGERLGELGSRVYGWFRVPADRFFHSGHAWVEPREPGVYRVGLDDFAHRLLGRADAVELPAAGSEIAAGRPGFALRVAGRRIPALAPLSGEVTRVNEAMLADPALGLADPYGAGWLFEVRGSLPVAAVESLYSGERARGWIERTTDALMGRMSPALGTVLQDGGVPVAGIARELDPEHWDELAAELLGTAAASETAEQGF